MRNGFIRPWHLLWLLLGFLAGGAGPGFASVGPLPRTDRELARAVRERLDRDPRLRSHRIAVSAQAGRIHLSGTVPNLARQREAIRLAAAQRGVFGIDSDLALRGPRLPDRTLRMDVTGKLSLYADLVPPGVTVAVDNGQVRVAGQVGTIGRYLFLREQLESLPGVEEIDLGALRIQTRTTERLDEEQLRVAVLHLIRDPYQFPVSGRIDVEAQDGFFVLKGTVPRLIDKMEALDVAALVVDRQRIRDELRIDPNLGRLRPHSGVPADRRLR